jgi:hypothetical protein
MGSAAPPSHAPLHALENLAHMTNLRFVVTLSALWSRVQSISKLYLRILLHTGWTY